MPFGATNPFPFRLGGDFTAEEQSRIATDLVSAMRTAPLGVLLINNGVPSVYFGRNGNGVATFDGGVTYKLGGTLSYAASVSDGLSVSLGSSWFDETNSEILVNIVGVDVFPIGGAAAPSSVEWLRNAFQLNGASGAYVMVIYSDDCQRTIDQYGGDLNKENSATEAESPYAWGWLLEMRNSRGSAYSTDGTVDIENLAWARMFGFLQRVDEQGAVSADPSRTSGGRLARWAEWLNITILASDSEAAVRAKCAAFKLLKLGAVEENLQASLSALLGPILVGVYRDAGLFDSPPVPTYWDENPGIPAVEEAIGLGDGGGTVPNDQPIWTSQRFHPTVVIQVPANQTVQQVANVCRSSLSNLLNNLLPSVADFSWGRVDSYGGENGFFLGRSLLGFDLI